MRGAPLDTTLVPSLCLVQDELGAMVTAINTIVIIDNLLGLRQVVSSLGDSA